jgi:hypothetical protein
MTKRFSSILGFIVTLGICLSWATTAFALPEGRQYELVSPLYKGGYDAFGITAVAPDGESVVFSSGGVFAGIPWEQIENSYIARRTPSGWLTAGLEPPFGGIADMSEDLSMVLGGQFVGSNAGVAYHVTEQQIMLHRTSAPDTARYWEVFGNIGLTSYDEGAPEAGELGADGRLCHVVLGIAGGALTPNAVGTTRPLYDLSRGCNGEPSLRLIAVNNEEEPKVLNPGCEVDLGVKGNLDPHSTNSERDATFNAVAARGEEIFFTTTVEKTNDCSGGKRQLFVRLAGERTLEVSRPLAQCEEVPCPQDPTRAAAYFKGASEDGSRVFFTTSAPLVNEDTDDGNDLYMATIGCPEAEPECTVGRRQVLSLTQVSHDANTGETAGVQGVVRIASDGSRLYFVAQGVLGNGVGNHEGQIPVAGADNFYTYETQTGETKFIADLCSGPASSGQISDVRCPTTLNGEKSGGKNDQELWKGGETQSTSDGNFLVFNSYGQLTRDDTDTARDIYRYDASADALERVSVGEDGFDANGNRDANADAQINKVNGGGINPGATSYQQHELSTRAISSDGSRIVFMTPDPLSPRAINGLTNVYEWHKEPNWSHGEVSLISSGSALVPDREAVMSASGHDIFFLTFQGLVPQDTEGDSDVYDARIGGGFPPAPTERQPCSSDACQGPLTSAAPLLVPGSETQTPGGNFAAPKPSTGPKGKKAKQGKVKRRKGVKRKAPNARRSAHQPMKRDGFGHRLKGR